MSESKKENLINYIPIILVLVINLVIVGIAWGSNVAKISTNADEIQDQKLKISTLEEKLTNIQVRVERIDTNVGILLKQNKY